MDITMCHGGDCPMKYDCYRFTATANEYRQSYFGCLPYESKIALPLQVVYTCEHFWDNKND